MKITGLIEAGVSVALALASAAVIAFYLGFQMPGTDFAPAWAAGTNPEHAYNPSAITAAQPETFQRGLRPFAYPPPSLLLFVPFGTLPLFAAYALFVSISLGLFAYAAQFKPWAVLTPPVALCAFSGQVTLIVGASLLLGLSIQDWRVRSELFAVAACIKKQLCVFLPIGLAIDRDWRTLAGTGAVGAVICLLATAMFGLSSWFRWVAAADAVVAQARDTFLGDYINGHIAGIIPALVIVGIAFRFSDNPAHRLAAIIAGALFVLPYAMPYELALLAPATFPLLGLLLGLAFQQGLPVVIVVMLGIAARELVRRRLIARDPTPPVR